MWECNWREQIWSSLDSPYDLIIVGGGITGAGILREAARLGLRTLLFEQDDFASGTSSRSSKLVHGGFRYLKNAQIKLTFDSVRERERLVREGRGLVTPLGFLMTSFKGDPIPGWVFGAGLIFYDLLAFKWGHRYYDAFDLCELCPSLVYEGLAGGYRYFDAQTDDARLVLRVIQEAVRDGGAAINYTRVKDLLRKRNGQVCGVMIEDQEPSRKGRTAEVQAPVVINATGAWADDLRQRIGGSARLRKLRGSHLIFPGQKLPLTRAISLLHPKDGRPIVVSPWEGVTVVGTTDVDHGPLVQTDPSISSAEVEYLMAVVRKAFPALGLGEEDIQSTFSGVRPVIDTGKADPSKESREHALWCENGVLTITGGKLTTFRLMAIQTLKEACSRLPFKVSDHPREFSKLKILDAPPAEAMLDKKLPGPSRLRLLGRYGADAPALLESAQPGELEIIPGSLSLWAELRWAARSEAVLHLDDLLLRRTRIGNTLPEGGLALIEQIQQVVQGELGWDNSRWATEAANYVKLWNECYYFKR